VCKVKAELQVAASCAFGGVRLK